MFVSQDLRSTAHALSLSRNPFSLPSASMRPIMASVTQTMSQASGTLIHRLHAFRNSSRLQSCPSTDSRQTSSPLPLRGTARICPFEIRFNTPTWDMPRILAASATEIGCFMVSVSVHPVQKTDPRRGRC